ncbi:tubulin epsilon and delta complex protein 2 isoform X2 [Choloepus didactylus]|uniref:tubulin epsilon and delta complex protein 2 isoform X2 n=1 Tax=Choloepus didactylus TaxID=27675 RepID=UPI0018A0BE32|nr:tubulin epsilon and delta complex protein 2 isoform X2 [Choloepus didactylus]
MLPADCSRRLVAELRGALDACAERQRQLERSLRVSRRLLRAWEPAATPAAEPTLGPEAKGEHLSPGEPRPPAFPRSCPRAWPAPSREQRPGASARFLAFSACTPSSQDLKELELLTQALEKAARVRKGISKAGGDKAPVPKSGSTVTPVTTTPSHLQAPGQADGRVSETSPPRGICQTKAPTKGHPERRLLSSEDRISWGRGARATRPGPGLRDQQTAPPAAQQAPEAFTLKEKGTLLQLPMAFRKAASQNSRLWAQISSTQTSDSADATTTAKTQFLQKMQTASGPHGPGLSAAEVEAELGRLQEACSLLRLRMEEEVAAAPVDWKQELRCLFTLEGLQALAGQCLCRLQELRAAVAEQQLGPWPVGGSRSTLSPCGAGADPARGPRLLLYSSTQELQTLVALRLQVAMLTQQIHLEKVLMAELLPLVHTQGRWGPRELSLCRAVHSLLCDAGERFPTVLQDEPTG